MALATQETLDAIRALLAGEGDPLPTTAATTLLVGTAEGQTTAGASAVVATGQTGGGHLMIINTSTTDAAYLTFSGATASDTKFLLPAGGTASITIPIADVTQVKCYSAGSPVLSWAFLQVPS